MEEAEVTLSGYLYKQGGAKGGFKNWKRRWFVLKEGSLYYYKDAAAKELLGVMPLQGSTLLFLQTPESRPRPPMLESKNCANCQTKFTLTTRRHHCRKCGNIFCHTCSSNEAPLPELDYDEPVRVCSRCYGLTLAELHQNATAIALRSQAQNIVASYEYAAAARGIGTPGAPALSPQDIQVYNPTLLLSILPNQVPAVIRTTGGEGVHNSTPQMQTPPQSLTPMAAGGSGAEPESAAAQLQGTIASAQAQTQAQVQSPVGATQNQEVSSPVLVRRMGSLAELIANSPILMSRSGPFTGSAVDEPMSLLHNRDPTSPALGVTSESSTVAGTPSSSTAGGVVTSSSDFNPSSAPASMALHQKAQTLGEALVQAGSYVQVPVPSAGGQSLSPAHIAARRSSGLPQFTLPTTFHRHLFALKNSERELWMKADSKEEQLKWVEAILRVARVIIPTPLLPSVLNPQLSPIQQSEQQAHTAEQQNQGEPKRHPSPEPTLDAAASPQPSPDDVRRIVAPIPTSAFGASATLDEQTKFEPADKSTSIDLVQEKTAECQLSQAERLSPSPAAGTEAKAAGSQDQISTGPPLDIRVEFTPSPQIPEPQQPLQRTPSSPLDETTRNLAVPTLRTPQLSLGSSRDPFAANWMILPQTIRLGPKVGSGAYGDVYRGTLWGTSVAVKKLSPNGRRPTASSQQLAETDGEASDLIVDQSVMEEIRKEISILSKLRHPNVVLYMGACIDGNRVSIITEWCARGSLYDVIYDFDKYFIDASLIIKLAMGIAQGMNYLHCLDSKIIHRDLKSQNVLLDTHLQPKIADFGLSHVRRSKQNNANPVIRSIARRLSTRTTVAPDIKAVGLSHDSTPNEPQDHYGIFGTPEWMAPEVMQGQWYTEKVDVYSYGILLSEIVSRQMPFSDQLQNRSYLDVACAVIEHGATPTLPKWCDQFLRNLILACLSRSPEARPSFTDIIRHLHDLANLDEEELFYRFDLPRIKELLAQDGPCAGPLTALGAREIAHLCANRKVYFNVYGSRGGRRSGRSYSAADLDETFEATGAGPRPGDATVEANPFRDLALEQARGWALPEDDVVYLMAKLSAQLTAEDSQARSAAIYALEGIMSVSNAGGKVFCANRLLEQGGLPALLALFQSYDESAMNELQSQGKKEVFNYPSVYSYLQHLALAGASAGAPGCMDDEAQVSVSAILGLPPRSREVDAATGAGADVGFRDVLGALGREGADVLEVANALLDMGINPLRPPVSVPNEVSSSSGERSGRLSVVGAYHPTPNASYVAMTLVTGRLLLEITGALARFREPLGWFVPAAPASIVPLVHALSADLTRFKRARAELSKEIAVRTRVLNIIQDALEFTGLRVLGPERAAFGLESDALPSETSATADSTETRDRLHIYDEELEIVRRLAKPGQPK